MESHRPILRSGNCFFWNIWPYCRNNALNSKKIIINGLALKIEETSFCDMLVRIYHITCAEAYTEHRFDMCRDMNGAPLRYVQRPERSTYWTRRDSKRLFFSVSYNFFAWILCYLFHFLDILKLSRHSSSLCTCIAAGGNSEIFDADRRRGTLKLLRIPIEARFSVVNFVYVCWMYNDAQSTWRICVA